MSACTETCSQGAIPLDLDATGAAKLRARVAELEQRTVALAAARDDAARQLRAVQEVTWRSGHACIRPGRCRCWALRRCACTRSVDVRSGGPDCRRRSQLLRTGSSRRCARPHAWRTPQHASTHSAHFSAPPAAAAVSACGRGGAAVCAPGAAQGGRRAGGQSQGSCGAGWCRATHMRMWTGAAAERKTNARTTHTCMHSTRTACPCCACDMPAPGLAPARPQAAAQQDAAAEARRQVETARGEVHALLGARAAGDQALRAKVAELQVRCAERRVGAARQSLPQQRMAGAWATQLPPSGRRATPEIRPIATPPLAQERPAPFPRVPAPRPRRRWLRGPPSAQSCAPRWRRATTWRARWRGGCGASASRCAPRGPISEAPELPPLRGSTPGHHQQPAHAGT